eukprot:CAMPEP_0119268172 /NCGR_PEP_ID=MMETSP1329-20130426/6039_1 /TAXON_ID=114041 /ORGANISM="Genus nov. species nov., Strain RCC1024" /LENGTH=240 /DNA_ID=CAMNT_0007268133 /DNA_START=257 /DNA_END=976 /DNA_ORIENTATION=-
MASGKPSLTPREKQRLKAADAEEQRSRLSVALGAGGLGAAAGLCVPVVGGVVLAAAGAAAAVGLTTRSDDVGEAARASGKAAASGVERVRAKLREARAGERLQASLSSVASSLRGSPEAAPAEPAQTGWLAAVFGAGDAERRAMRERLGAAKTPADAARSVCADLAAAPADRRRRQLLELLRDLHPDKQRNSTVSDRAVAASLTNIVVCVRDYLDEVGWDAFEARGASAVADEVGWDAFE